MFGLSAASSPQVAAVPQPVSSAAADEMNWISTASADRTPFRAEDTGMQYLRRHLSPTFYDSSDTDSDKDAHIETVLTNSMVNDYLRAKVKWLLPNNATLCDLMNCNGKWAPLVAALTEVAERGIGETDTTFPVTNPRRAVESALSSLNALPFIEIVLYDPKMSAEDRNAAWTAAAPNVISQAELIDWLKKPDSMKNKNLSQPQMNSFLSKLMTQLEQDMKLRSEVLKTVHQKQPAWTVANFDSLIHDLFEQGAPAAAAPVLNFTSNQSWTAKAFLKSLGITNPTLEANLKEMESDLEMFELRPKAEWPGELVRLGARGAENLKVTKALITANLIK